MPIALRHRDRRRGAPAHNLRQDREGDATFEQPGAGGVAKIVEAAGNDGAFALLCAWTFLNDQHIAHDLMDHAIANAMGYIARHPGVTR